MTKIIIDCPECGGTGKLYIVKRAIICMICKGPEKIKKINHEWRKNNKYKYQRSICISLLKKGLKKGTITLQEIQQILKTHKKEVKKW